MKIEPQVTSLELSKRLRELGVKQESLFYWGDKPSDIECYSAFTASELLDLLPSFINDWMLKIESNNGVYEIKYSDFSGEKQLWVSHHTNFVNSVATMIIYLIENKLIEV
jgi:hypothetical protein